MNYKSIREVVKTKIEKIESIQREINEIYNEMEKVKETYEALNKRVKYRINSQSALKNDIGRISTIKKYHTTK